MDDLPCDKFDLHGVAMMIFMQAHSKVFMLVNKLQKNVIHFVSNFTDAKAGSNLHYLTFSYVYQIPFAIFSPIC